MSNRDQRFFLWPGVTTQASPSVRGSITLRGEISGSPSYCVHLSLADLHAFRPCHEFPGAKLGYLCFHLCFLSKNTVWATLTSEQPILPLHIPDQQHNFATPATTHTTFSAVNPTSTRQEAPARGFPNAIALGGPSFFADVAVDTYRTWCLFFPVRQTTRGLSISPLNMIFSGRQ